MKDVARNAQVGVSTVSRVINANGSVSAETRERVNNSISRLGFNPNPIAQSMRSGLTKMFACIVRDFSVPVLSRLISSMQTVVDAQGFGVQVASSHHNVEREIDILRKLYLRRTDGIVIATSSETDLRILNALEELAIPVVLLDREMPAKLDAVQIDHRYGVRSAIGSLLDLGHTRVSLIGGQPDVRPTNERVEGYKEAFKLRGLEISHDLIRLGAFDTEYAYSEVAMLLRKADRPTAILAGGTAMLGGVLRAVRDAGLRIPQDISLVSGAESELALLHSPGISAVGWNSDQLGIAIARLMLQRIERPEDPVRRVIIPTELIQRGSSGPPPK